MGRTAEVLHVEWLKEQSSLNTCVRLRGEDMDAHSQSRKIGMPSRIKNFAFLESVLYVSAAVIVLLACTICTIELKNSRFDALRLFRPLRVASLRVTFRPCTPGFTLYHPSPMRASLNSRSASLQSLENRI